MHSRMHCVFNLALDTLFSKKAYVRRSPRTLKIMLPCRRELDFEKIVLFLSKIDLDAILSDFRVVGTPKIKLKTVQNRCKINPSSQEAPKERKRAAEEAQDVAKSG